ncbi:glycosyltransferase [Herbiconiux sp. KACC 21604]|uniref:glycosyltransferase family 2 protein n=1 Tax=unclassified Herbiconiux TaxID=2618217 RepID=UPI00273A4F86|nr:glycosyltransferase [Herbiconiux sp. SALV-R1]WPO85847.1 glycosyltransferase [Herbiconiux sp. KACC 21604]
MSGVDHAVPANDWTVLDGLVADPAPLVSVIVVHYEQPADLARTLHALGRQSYDAALVEVIVVDDGSAHPPAVPEGVRLVVQPDRGFRVAAARNAGAALARGEVLCFLDADTSPEPGYVEALTRLPALCSDVVTVGRRRHAEFAASAGAGASAAAARDDAAAGDAAAAGERVEPGEPVEIAGPRAELTEPQWLREAYARSRDLLEADQRSYRFVISAVLACSRRIFELTGGFDESFDAYGGEDWEWADRAWRLGAVFAHVPEAVAWHAGPDLAERSADRDELVRRKNAEALVLLDRIAVVPARRDRGLLSAAVDVVVEVPSGSAAASVVCADVVLAALPAARVLIDDDHAARLAGDARVLGRHSAAAEAARTSARVVVRASHLFTVPRDARPAFADQLTTATEQVGTGTLGWRELVTAHPADAAVDDSATDMAADPADTAVDNPGTDAAADSSDAPGAPAADMTADPADAAPGDSVDAPGDFADTVADDAPTDPTASAPALVIEVAAARAEHRRARRPDAHGFVRDRQPCAASALLHEPDLEAHLAGWGG